MLDIPESVKTLFNQDSIRKNFRAVFDSDLVVTNADITWNSLRFRESICSADSVTFGMAEASVLNFETRGVRNMLGEWFDAWTEIDASTLPEELQTVREDLDYPVYPVPLGRFVVTACPRNHEAMAKRKVTAMSTADASNWLTGGALNEILSQPMKRNPKNPMQIHLRLDRILPAAGFPEDAAASRITNISSRSNNWTASRYGEIGVNGYTLCTGSAPSPVPLYAAGVSASCQYSQIAQLPKDTAFRFVYPGPPDDVDLDRITREIAQQLFEAHSFLYLYRSGERIQISSPSDPVFLDFLHDFFSKKGYFNGYFRFVDGYSSGSGVKHPLESIAGQFTPFPTFQASIGSQYSITWSSAYAISATNGSNLVYAVSEKFREDNPTINSRFDALSPDTSEQLIIIDAVATSLGGTSVSYDFGVAGWLPELVGGILELRGVFGTASRDGGKGLKALSDTPVMRIGCGQISSAWWDEFDIAPIGSIVYKLQNEEFVYPFGDGKSQYVFQNSGLFDRLPNCTTSMIRSLMNQQLVPALRDLTFTPAEIDSRGLPYLEAGDCIELEAEDGSIIKTYALEREMHGTQHLTDRITADGITISEVGISE